MLINKSNFKVLGRKGKTNCWETLGILLIWKFKYSGTKTSHWSRLNQFNTLELSISEASQHLSFSSRLLFLLEPHSAPRGFASYFPQTPFTTISFFSTPCKEQEFQEIDCCCKRSWEYGRGSTVGLPNKNSVHTLAECRGHLELKILVKTVKTPSSNEKGAGNSRINWSI